MQVALHFGAPFTDENRLQLCLGKNRDRLAQDNILVPRPSSYRKSLRPMMQQFRDGSGDDSLRQEFIDELAGGAEPDRIVFSTDTFLAIPRLSIRQNQFYLGFQNRFDSFLSLFEGAEVELFLAICNPVTYLQGLTKAYENQELDALIDNSDPLQLRWSTFISQLRASYPQLPITVWCNEDSPLIWMNILRSVTGVDESYELDGAFDFLQEMMTDEGFKRFEEYLSKRPGITPAQQVRVSAAFLEKFVREELLEEEIDLPGWTELQVDMMSELYEQDVEEIAQIPNLNFLTP